MAKRRTKKPKSKVNGWVYIIEMLVGGELLYKIGTTNRSPRIRLGEIALEIYDILGYIPKMSIIESGQTRDNYKVEKDLLEQTIKYCPKSDCILWEKFNGFSELRVLGKEELVVKYKECMCKDYPVVQPMLVQM